MPRPRIPRRIFSPPRFLHFKPVAVPRRLLDSVTMTVDEVEAVRLADREGMDQQEAAERMGISRPTFSRLIDAARAKLAQCIIDGKELIIEGGDVDFENDLQRCQDCGDEVVRAVEAEAGRDRVDDACRVCGSERVEDLAFAAMSGRKRGRQARDRHRSSGHQSGGGERA